MDDFPLVRKTLPSGLRVVLLPREERTVVTFMVLMGVGSRYETAKQAGLSHFLEHMFFKGTSTRPSSQEIAEAIDTVGGAFNAFTSEEVTAYHVTVAAHHFDRAADVVSDILLRPLFSPDEIERERGVITEEIRMYTGMPTAHIRHLWSQLLWGDHPLGRRVDGSEATVAGFGRQDFVEYVQAHYHTGNTVVAVAGKFDPAQVTAHIEQLFSDLPQGAETQPVPAASEFPTERFLHERRAHLEQTHLVMGVPGVSLTDERRFATELLAAILGGGMSSRLFLSVRERNGLAYTVRTNAQSFTDTGELATYAGVRTDKAALAVSLIAAEYDRIMIEKVPSEELRKVKEMVYGHMMLELEETHSLAVSAGADELLTREVLTPAEVRERIEAVTADDVQRVAQALLAPSQRALAVLSPHADEEIGALRSVVVQ